MSTEDQAPEESAPFRLTPELYTLIEDTIAEVRPGIEQDGGEISLVAIEDGIVRVALGGACTHCGMAGQTLGGLRRRLIAVTGQAWRVLPADVVPRE